LPAASPSLVPKPGLGNERKKSVEQAFLPVPDNTGQTEMSDPPLNLMALKPGLGNERKNFRLKGIHFL